MCIHQHDICPRPSKSLLRALLKNLRVINKTVIFYLMKVKAKPFLWLPKKKKKTKCTSVTLKLREKQIQDYKLDQTISQSIECLLL